MKKRKKTLYRYAFNELRGDGKTLKIGFMLMDMHTGQSTVKMIENASEINELLKREGIKSGYTVITDYKEMLSDKSFEEMSQHLWATFIVQEEE